MTTGIRERDNLYTKLREVLGNEQATTLMGMLPTDNDQLATKADTGALSADIDDLRVRMDRLEERMDRLEERMDRLEERMDRLEELMKQFDERLWDFHEAMRAQTRVYITAMVSGMIGVGGLAMAGNALIG